MYSSIYRLQAYSTPPSLHPPADQQLNWNCRLLLVTNTAFHALIASASDQAQQVSMANWACVCRSGSQLLEATPTAADAAAC